MPLENKFDAGNLVCPGSVVVGGAVGCLRKKLVMKYTISALKIKFLTTDIKDSNLVGCLCAWLLSCGWAWSTSLPF